MREPRNTLLSHAAVFCLALAVEVALMILLFGYWHPIQGK